MPSLVVDMRDCHQVILTFESTVLDENDYILLGSGNHRPTGGFGHNIMRLHLINKFIMQKCGVSTGEDR